ncbi:MAG: hypothetical protein ABSF32_08740 [Ignavibacteria bacterium]|jgi:hypothetical protein
MKTTFLLISIFLFTACMAFAQQYEDVVYLKNGGEIHGTIIEQVPNVSIKIKTNEGNIFVYKMEEIEKITKKEITDENTNEEKTNLKLKNRTRGLFFRVDLEIGGPTGSTPSGGDWQDIYAVHLGNNYYLGYMLNKNFTLAGNLGWSLWFLDADFADATGFGNAFMLTWGANLIAGDLKGTDLLVYWGRFGLGGQFITAPSGSDGDTEVGGYADFAGGLGFKITKKGGAAIFLELGFKLSMTDKVPNTGRIALGFTTTL